MTILLLYLPLLQQTTENEIPVFRLVLVVLGAIFLTSICFRIAMRMIGGSLDKASRKPILKRFFDNDKRRP